MTQYLDPAPPTVTNKATKEQPARVVTTQQVLLSAEDIEEQRVNVDRQDLGALGEMPQTAGNLSDEQEAKRHQLSDLIFGPADKPRPQSETAAQLTKKMILGGHKRASMLRYLRARQVWLCAW